MAVALVLGVGVLALRRTEIPAYGLRFLAQLGTPLLVLAPWSLSLLPFGFFREAGLEYGPSAASALDLLGASPGGPGTVGGPLLIGLVFAALAALLRTERRTAILTAWAAALVGLVFAVLSNDSAWAGPATLVYGIAVLAAATLGADGARARVAEQSFGWRQPVAALIALACAIGPLVAVAGWMIRGADGPVERRDPVQVPAFVAEESGTRDQARTLVLDSEGLAKAVLRDRTVTGWLALARADDLRVITSAATLVEVVHPRINRPALEWTLSRLVVEPVTEPIARHAAALLADASLHGHKYAIDAMLSATALAAPGPVTILTSDPEDLTALCGRRVTVIKI